LSSFSGVRGTVTKNAIYFLCEVLALILRQRVEASSDVLLNGTPIIAVALGCFAADGCEGHKIRVQLWCIVHI
jgi:hypothetical protein